MLSIILSAIALISTANEIHANDSDAQTKRDPGVASLNSPNVNDLEAAESVRFFGGHAGHHHGHHGHHHHHHRPQHHVLPIIPLYNFHNHNYWDNRRRRYRNKGRVVFYG